MRFVPAPGSQRWNAYGTPSAVNELVARTLTVEPTSNWPAPAIPVTMLKAAGVVTVVLFTITVAP